jgi:hypothetical protein
MSWREVSKKRAFLSHLGVSATLVGSVILLVFFVWYPEPFFEAVGTWSIVRILVGVDLVLGPLLTLIVFRPRKPRLLLDMSVIAAVQAAALVYGVSVLYQERPYYLVFAVDRFHILAREDIVAPEPAWASKPLRGPEKVVAKLPEDPVARNRLVEETVFGGAPDIELRPEFWTRYASETENIAARAAPLAALRRAGDTVARQVDGIVQALGVSEDALGFLPINSKKRDAAAIIDKSTAEIVAVIAVDPWPLLRKAA